ncbi:MAG: hypothetical protein F6K47_25110 [Symploca sp. SIO2E6]|nr:hypothetical protein [Symploca sp. SIO2E6]
MIKTVETTLNQHLQSLPAVSVSIRSNQTYVNIATVRHYSDGTIIQSLQIINKPELDVTKSTRLLPGKAPEQKHKAQGKSPLSFFKAGLPVENFCTVPSPFCPLFSTFRFLLK